MREPRPPCVARGPLSIELKPSSLPNLRYLTDLGAQSRGSGKGWLADWCERRDSNSHGLPHRLLRPARLPVPPLSPASDPGPRENQGGIIAERAPVRGASVGPGGRGQTAALRIQDLTRRNR